jgi:hypothetical protein
VSKEDSTSSAAAASGSAVEPVARAEPRSWLERIGLALVAIVMAIIFAGLSVAAWIGGEGFLAAMAGIGALMTVWAAVANLRRG